MALPKELELQATGAQVWRNHFTSPFDFDCWEKKAKMFVYDTLVMMMRIDDEDHEDSDDDDGKQYRKLNLNMIKTKNLNMTFYEDPAR